MINNFNMFCPTNKTLHRSKGNWIKPKEKGFFQTIPATHSLLYLKLSLKCFGLSPLLIQTCWETLRIEKKSPNIQYEFPLRGFIPVVHNSYISILKQWHLLLITVQACMSTCMYGNVCCGIIHCSFDMWHHGLWTEVRVLLQSVITRGRRCNKI